MMNWMLYTMFNWARELASQRKQAKDEFTPIYYVIDEEKDELLFTTADRNKAYRRMAREIYVNNRNFTTVITQL